MQVPISIIALESSVNNLKKLVTDPEELGHYLGKQEAEVIARALGEMVTSAEKAAEIGKRLSAMGYIQLEKWFVAILEASEFHYEIRGGRQ